MNRSRLHLIAVLLLTAAVAGCSQLGDIVGTRRADEDRRTAQKSNEQRANLTTRLSANDQIRLRMRDLRIALNLKPEQIGAWQAYDDKVIEILSDLAHTAGGPADGNALSQADQRVAAEQKRAVLMQQLSNAARKLYTTLSDEQKRTADRLLPGTIP
jgi:hypothetical protein